MKDKWNDYEKLSFRELLRLQSRRRGHLKAALRRYADIFDISWWFYKRNSEGRMEIAGDVPSNIFDPALPYEEVPKKLKDFEACGTTCCIAGLDYIRSGRNRAEQCEFYGFSSDVFFAGRWPDSLADEYNIARMANDYIGMVVAAEKAIDYYAAKMIEEDVDVLN